MKKLVILISFIFSLGVAAEELRALVRFEKSAVGLKIMRMEKGDHIPSIPANEEVKQLMASLPDGSEAVMEGHVTYELIGGTEAQQLRPIFVVEKLHPVSLKDLGKDAQKVSLQAFAPPKTSTLIYRQPSMAVTTEVASAITLTTSLLMIEQLTSGDNDPDGRRQMRQALFLSTGAIATLLFVYEQLQGKAKP